MIYVCLALALVDFNIFLIVVMIILIPIPRDQSVFFFVLKNINNSLDRTLLVMVYMYNFLAKSNILVYH